MDRETQRQHLNRLRWDAISPTLLPLLVGLPPTEFIGYDVLECDSTVLAVIPFVRNL